MTEIPGRYRLAEISANTGRTLRVLAINFRGDTDAVEYAHGYLGLDRPDLDNPAAWRLTDTRTLVLQLQEG